MAPHESSTAPHAPASPPLLPRTPTPASACSPLRKTLATSSSSSCCCTTDTSKRTHSLHAPAAAATNSKKRVRWSTITIHEFGVGLGGSAVPTKGGPAIGLGAAPEFTWVTKVGEMAERSEGVHRFSAEERVRLLQAAGESDGMILRFSRETNIILTSRRRALADKVSDNATAADGVEASMQRSKKRKAPEHEREARPCASYLTRPRMIPANYV